MGAVGSTSSRMEWNRTTAAKYPTVMVTHRKMRSGLRGQLALNTAWMPTVPTSR